MMSTRIGIGYTQPHFEYTLATPDEATAIAQEVYWMRPLKVYVREIDNPILLALCQAWLAHEPQTLPATVMVMDAQDDAHIVDEDTMIQVAKAA